MKRLAHQMAVIAFSQDYPAREGSPEDVEARALVARGPHRRRRRFSPTPAPLPSRGSCRSRSRVAEEPEMVLPEAAHHDARSSRGERLGQHRHPVVVELADLCEVDAHLRVRVRLSERSGEALRGRDVEDAIHPDHRRAIGVHSDPYLRERRIIPNELLCRRPTLEDPCRVRRPRTGPRCKFQRNAVSARPGVMLDLRVPDPNDSLARRTRLRATQTSRICGQARAAGRSRSGRSAAILRFQPGRAGGSPSTRPQPDLEDWPAARRRIGHRSGREARGRPPSSTRPIGSDRSDASRRPSAARGRTASPQTNLAAATRVFRFRFSALGPPAHARGVGGCDSSGGVRLRC